MLQRLIHIVLAFLFFISSTGLVINKHYCQNELKNMALFVKAEGCHTMKQMSCPMHSSPEDESPEKGCCDDETEYVKVDEEQQIQLSEINIKLNPVLMSVLFVALNLDWPSLDKQSIHYLNYKPPLIVCDLPVSLQTFLC